MKYNLSDRVLKDRISTEKTCVRFKGKGANRKKSDIDLAVSSGNFDKLYWNINGNAWTLLFFDIIELERGIIDQLKREIERDGVTIYEKAR